MPMHSKPPQYIYVFLAFVRAYLLRACNTFRPIKLASSPPFDRLEERTSDSSRFEGVFWYPVALAQHSILVLTITFKFNQLHAAAL
jgi:hypothetical protein